MKAFASAVRRSRYIPLELKLPLVITVLLSAALAAFAWLSYVEVRRATLQSARSRVENVADALAAAFERDAASTLRRMRDIAADPGLAAYLSGGVRTEAAAGEALDRLTETADSILSTVILSRDGSPLLWSPSETEEEAIGRGELSSATAAAPADGGYGPFFWQEGQLRSWVTVPVLSTHEQIGWLAELHVLDTELQALALDSMIAEPAVRLASAPGELWSTLNGEPVPAPTAWPFTGARDYERPAVGPQLAHATEIAGTAWAVVAEVPADEIHASVQGFVWRIAPTAAGLIIAAASAAWLLGRGLTRSIRRLRVAAQAIAAGTAGDSVTVRHGGELGALAATLSDVTAQVQARRRELEVQHGEARELAAQLVRQNAVLEQGLAVEKAGRAQAGRTSRAAVEYLARVSHEIRTPLPIEPRIALLEEAVETVLATLRPQAASKGVVITETCSCDSTTFYYGDPKRVEQIVLDLVANAVELTPAPGRIHIDCRTWAEGEKRSSQVVVEDAGIPADQLEHIFDPFAQADADGVVAGMHGVSLRFAISRELARMMGGDIVVEGDTRRGSRFVLHLPPVAQRVDSAASRSTVE